MTKSARTYRFKTLRPLGRLAVILLGLGLVVAAVELVHDVRLLLSLNAIAAGEEGAVADYASALDGGDIRLYAYIAVLVATASAFFAWVYRANANAHALGFARMAFRPGWAIGWWFVPIANLIQPARIVAELYRVAAVGDPSAARHRIGIGPVIAWWLLVLLSNGVDRYGNRQMDGETVETVRQGVVAFIAGDLMFLVAGGLAIFLVHRITAGIDGANAAARTG